MPSYLIHFAIVHSEFRLPELESVGKIHGFEVTLPEDAEERDPSRPFMIVELEREEHARMLARRCILIRCACWLYEWGLVLKLGRAIYEFWLSAPTYSDLHTQNRAHLSLWQPYMSSTHKWHISSKGHTIPQSRMKVVVDSFAYVGLKGRIDLSGKVEEVFAIFEECASCFWCGGGWS